MERVGEVGCERRDVQEMKYHRQLKSRAKSSKSLHYQDNTRRPLFQSITLMPHGDDSIDAALDHFPQQLRRFLENVISVFSQGGGV